MYRLQSTATATAETRAARPAGFGQDGSVAGNAGGSAALPVIDVRPLAGGGPAGAMAAVAGWIDAPPIPGTLVSGMGGDLLA
jgi:hypothetical protein